MADKEDAHMPIGEVAERTGVTQRTLRFYEERGLLKPPSRMEGGFRLYSEEDVARVERIKRLQALLGVSLSEVKEMVDAEELALQIEAEYQSETDVGEKRRQIAAAIEVTEQQYAIVCQKAEHLAEMKTHLQGRLKTYRGWKRKLKGRATVSR